MRRNEIGRVSQRAHMILLSNRHYCVAEIARIFDATQGSVRRWIERFEKEGIDCLLHNFSIHKAKAVQEWLASHPRVRLYYLPCYMPQLNPVEKIWWRLKAVVAANRLHGTMGALIDAVKTFFELLASSEALTLAA